MPSKSIASGQDSAYEKWGVAAIADPSQPQTDERTVENSTLKPYFAHIVSGLSQVEKDTQLVEAAVQGDMAQLGELLDLGADPRTANNSPLRLAAANGHAESVKVLIRGGAEPADSEALLRAAKSGYSDVVSLLASHADQGTLEQAVKLAEQHEIQTPGAFRVRENTPARGHDKSIEILRQSGQTRSFEARAPRI